MCLQAVERFLGIAVIESIIGLRTLDKSEGDKDENFEAINGYDASCGKFECICY